jgi:hypothetical protein
VGDAVGFDHARAFEIELMSLEVGEHANAVAEEERDQVYVDLVDETGLAYRSGGSWVSRKKGAPRGW